MKIFVGGTGRSGTTVLSRWLGSHEELARIPLESRFIVDSGGIIDLHHNLTSSYSHDRARMAARRFFALMERDLVSSWSAPYVGFDFERLFPKNYRNSVEKLRREIVIDTFNGSDFHSVSRLPRTIDTYLRRFWVTRTARLLGQKVSGKRRTYLPNEEILLCRRFESEEFLRILGCFVDTLFDEFALSSGARGWCEDTPANILHIRFLNDMFPDSRHMHIVRNPYGVANSFTSQLWAPCSFELSVQLLAQLYKQIIRTLEDVSEAQRKAVVTIHLESLWENDCQEWICEWLDIEPARFDGSVQLRQISAEEDRSRLSQEEVALVDNNLGFALEYFGYLKSI